MIEAKIICDSLNPVGCRLTTFVLKYPRFILAEVNTHKILVKNSVSMRAVPVNKIIDSIRNETAMPVYWGKNQRTMKADEELPESVIIQAEEVWLQSMKSQIRYAEQLLELGVHKQITNRLLEPFFYVKTLLSGTDFGNFFNLRAHPDAQPEFQELAFCMLDEYEKSQPKQLSFGDFHLPFSDQYIEDGLSTEQLLKITTARAARVSYMNFEGNIDYEKDYKLHDDLKKAGHFSCFEHAAKTEEDNKYYANFRGFIQYRKFISGENRTEFNPTQLRAARRHFKR
jgi:thymidylate synthase ThyX